MAARSVARAYRTLVGVHLAPEHWKSIRPFLGHRRVEDAVTNPPYKKALACAKKLIVEYRYVALLGSHKFLRRNRAARCILRGQSADSGMVPFAPLADVGLIPLVRPEEVEQYGTLLAYLGKRNAALAAARFQLEETARGPHKAGSAAASAGAVTA